MSCTELRDEVERKLEVGVAWGAAPRSSPLQSTSGETDWRNISDSVEQNEWREIPWDAETLAMRRLSSSAVDILEGLSSPFKKPRWVEEFEQNRRRMELSGREGAETLDRWCGQAEERIATLLARRPWGLLHLLSLLRRLPTDTAFQGERAKEGAASRFDVYQADVAERAVLKYALWDSGGVGLDTWEPGMPGLVQDRSAVDAQRLAEVLALVRLGAVHLAYPERMGRAIVRGQTVILRPDGVSDSRPDPRMRRRLDLYEERRMHWAHRHRKDGKRSPAEVLGFLTSVRHLPEALERAFFSTRFTRVLNASGYARIRHWKVYAEEGLARREVTLWLAPEALTVEFAGEPLARYEVQYSPGNAELRKVGRAILFETSVVAHQPRLFDLTEALGEKGWLKALRLEDYVMREPRQPQMLQEMLFSFFDAV